MRSLALPAARCNPTRGRRANTPACWTIRAHQIARGGGNRNVCLIPPAPTARTASAAMAGMEVVVVATDDNGNINVEDPRAKAEQHATGCRR